MEKTVSTGIDNEPNINCINLNQFMFRVLYVDQFTESGREECEEIFYPQNIQDVFEHFQPKVKVLLKTDEGNTEYEYITFKHIEDFDDEQLITQIKSLPHKTLYLSENLHNVRLAIRQLEVAYRTLDSFFQLARDCDRQVITLMNINKEDLYEENSDGFKYVRY